MTSTINPTVPATDSPLTSQPIRDNFLSAYNDINGIQVVLAGLGNLSTQNQNNVTITGGTIAGTTVGLFTPTTSGAVAASGGGTSNFLRADGTWATAGGSGTVTSVSVITANGVSGTVANPTTTPAISIALGAITPSSVAAVGAISASAATFTSLSSGGIVKSSVGGGVVSNAVAGTDYQAPITLTTTGTSGVATFVANTLNIPNYVGGVSSVFGRTGAVVATSGDYNTSLVTENTNLYFTNARAIASTLTGYTSGAGTISSTDSILGAIQKLNGNTAALVTGVSGVTNSDGTLTISPTTGAVVASLALGHANTWTGQQTFNTSAPIFGTMTAGSVLFAGTSGLLSQDNAKFFWNDTTFSLGLGRTSVSNASLSTKGNIFVNAAATSNFAWSTALDVIQYGNSGAVWGNNNGAFQSFHGNNVINLPSAAYMGNSYAQLLTFDTLGNIILSTAPLNASGPGAGLTLTARVFVSNAGGVGFGNSSPSAGVHVTNTTEQLRLAYDVSDYASFTVGSTGVLNVKPTGTANGLMNVWDGTQGLIIGAYTGGAASGAIYPSTVTPGASNYSFAAAATGTTLQANSGNQFINMSPSGISTTVTTANTITFNTNMPSTTPAVVFNNIQNSITNPSIGSFLAANTAASASSGAGPFFNLGIAAATQNSAVVQFNYIGSGSNSNTLSFGIYGTPNVMFIARTAVSIGSNTMSQLFNVGSAAQFNVDTSGNVNTTGVINNNTALTTLNGTTAGTIKWSQPFQGAALKKFVGYASGYENNTATNQTITFTVAFTNTPIITANNTGLTLTVSTTTLTIASPISITPFTGTIIIEGY